LVSGNPLLSVDSLPSLLPQSSMVLTIRTLLSINCASLDYGLLFLFSQFCKLDIVLNLSVKRDLEILVENYKNNAHMDNGQGWEDWWTALPTRVMMRMTTQPKRLL